MDAAMAVTALRHSDMYALVKSLDVDAIHVEPMPEGVPPHPGSSDHGLPGDPATLAVITRIGTTLLLVAPSGDLEVRRHETDA